MGLQTRPRQTEGAGQFQWIEIIYVAMHYQSLTAVNRAGPLLGRDKVTRLDRPEGAESIELDDWEGAKELLPGEARKVAARRADEIAETFFTRNASRMTALA